MNNEIKKWIKDNCQDTPTRQKLIFYALESSEPFTVYLKDGFKGYLIDDIDMLLGDDNSGNDNSWYAVGDDIHISNEELEVIIIKTPITNSPLF